MGSLRGPRRGTNGPGMINTALYSLLVGWYLVVSIDRIIVCRCLWSSRPAGRRGTVGVTEEATEERPFHLLKALCDCWYLLLVVRFRSLPPSPSSLRSSSPLPAHHVLKCVSPPDAAFANQPSSVSYRALVHPTGDCPHLEVKNPSASSYLT